VQTFVQSNDVKSKLSEMFRLGMTKRELHSRVNNRYYLLVENDGGDPNGYRLLLMDDEATGDNKEFLYIGKNLQEEQALELAVNFATHSRLF